MEKEVESLLNTEGLKNLNAKKLVHVGYTRRKNCILEI